MGWFRVTLAADEPGIVNVERDAHPAAHVHREMLVLWFLHGDLSRPKAVQVVGLGRATVPWYVAADRESGLDGQRQWDVVGPVSDLPAQSDNIRASPITAPVRTVAEACARIETLAGIRRRPSPVRQFRAGFLVAEGPGRSLLLVVDPPRCSSEAPPAASGPTSWRPGTRPPERGRGDQRHRAEHRHDL